MARKIIILEKLDSPPGLNHYRYALWADVPAARQPYYANTSTDPNVVVTAVKDATAGEIAAIKAGQIAERVAEQQWATGVSLVSIQGQLITAFNDFQAEVTAYNPWLRLGTFWDGTSWTAKGVA